VKPNQRLILVLSSLLLAVALAFVWLSAAQAALSQTSAGQPPMSMPAAPAARSHHSLTLVGSDIYLFGGSSITGTGGARNDLWRFESQDSTWHTVSITQTGPSARRRHAAASMNDKLYILGGEDQNGKKLDDAWIYDPATGAWSEAKQDTRPPARSNHTAIANGDRFLVYGGNFQTYTMSADVWSYSPTTGYWSIDSWLSNPQGTNAGHTAGLIGGKMYFAGGGNTSSADLLQAYDLSSRSFESVTTTLSSPKPVQRRYHAGVVTSSEIYIFGGTYVTGTGTLKDAWRFSPLTSAWTRLPDLPEPLSGAQASTLFSQPVTQTRSIHSDSISAASVNILIFGGITGQGKTSSTGYVFTGSEYLPLVVEKNTYLPLVMK